MELKHGLQAFVVYLDVGFNRTFMELKLVFSYKRKIQ